MASATVPLHRCVRLQSDPVDISLGQEPQWGTWSPLPAQSGKGLGQIQSVTKDSTISLMTCTSYCTKPEQYKKSEKNHMIHITIPLKI